MNTGKMVAPPLKEDNNCTLMTYEHGITEENYSGP